MMYESIRARKDALATAITRHKMHQRAIESIHDRIKDWEADARTELVACQVVGRQILHLENRINIEKAGLNTLMNTEIENDLYPESTFINRVDCAEDYGFPEPAISESELRLAAAKNEIAAFGKTTPEGWNPTIRDESSHKEKGGD